MSSLLGALQEGPSRSMQAPRTWWQGQGQRKGRDTRKGEGKVRSRGRGRVGARGRVRERAGYRAGTRIERWME